MTDDRVLRLLAQLHTRSAGDSIMHWLFQAHAALLNDDPSDALQLAHQAWSIAARPDDYDHFGSALCLTYIGTAWLAFNPPCACSSYRYAVQQFEISLRLGGKTNATVVRRILEVVGEQPGAAESAAWDTLTGVPTSDVLDTHKMI